VRRPRFLARVSDVSVTRNPHDRNEVAAVARALFNRFSVIFEPQLPPHTPRGAVIEARPRGSEPGRFDTRLSAAAR